MNSLTDVSAWLRGRSVVWLALVALSAACTVSQSPPVISVLSTTAPVAPSTTLAAVRGCDESIGTVKTDESPDYLERSVRVGPAILEDAATLWEITAELGPDSDNRYLAIKIPLTVAAGETVTIAIGSSSLDWASLMYDPASFRSTGRYDLAEGTEAMTFVACDEGDTFFNGGVIVTSPGCLELLVTSNNEEQRALIPIAQREC